MCWSLNVNPKLMGHEVPNEVEYISFVVRTQKQLQPAFMLVEMLGGSIYQAAQQFSDR